MTVSKLTIATVVAGLAVTFGSATVAQDFLIQPLMKTAQAGLPTPLGAAAGITPILTVGVIGIPGIPAGAASQASLLYSLASPEASTTTTTPPAP